MLQGASQVCVWGGLPCLQHHSPQPYPLIYSLQSAQSPVTGGGELPATHTLSPSVRCLSTFVRVSQLKLPANLTQISMHSLLLPVE